MANFNYEPYHDFIYETYQADNDLNFTQIARLLIDEFNLDIEAESARKYISRYIRNKSSDKELLELNVRYKKEKQKAQDVNRIERKGFRESARVENAVSEYAKAIKEQNKHFGKSLAKFELKPLNKKKTKEIVGLIQITDTHCNEMIDLPHNQYNFRVFAKRLKKYISESLRYFEFQSVDKVVIAFTGDLLNSDRRLDEMLNQSTNRAKATVLAVHIFKQAILDVRSAGYDVTIVSVMGNESRAKQEMSFSHEAISDNYDFTIVSQLKEMFEFADIKGIRFGSIDQMETIIEFPEQKWLMAHNINKMCDDQNKTQSTIGKFAINGELISFVIGGHIHSLRVTDHSARSASMAGSNTYNEHALNLMGRAAAICYVIDGKERRVQVIDLQEYNNEGYEIISKLEAYNVKSELKLHETTTVFKVVI